MWGLILFALGTSRSDSLQSITPHGSDLEHQVAVRVATELRWGTVAADLIWTKVCRSPYRGPPEIAASVDIVVVAWAGDHRVKSLLQQENFESPRGHPQLWWTGAQTIAGGFGRTTSERCNRADGEARPGSM
jgi:hypothetical protein